jgi:hypothetical protein
MEALEYLTLEASPSQKRNFLVSVVFNVEKNLGYKPRMPSREIDVGILFSMIRSEPFIMEFDEHPYWVTGISFDLSNRRARITAVHETSAG